MIAELPTVCPRCLSRRIATYNGVTYCFECPRVGKTCPECNGTRTMSGATDQTDMAAWLDCTTCSAIPKGADSGSEDA